MRRTENQGLRSMVREILAQELHSVLHDVTYRLNVLYDAMAQNGRLGSRDLNLAVHQLDGFTVTDNTPTAGSIAWTDVNIVYKGTNYSIADGNTNKKYVWWKMSAAPNTAFQMTDEKPTLTDDDVLVFINDAGIHQTVVGSGRMTSGAAILAGTVSGSEIGSDAVGSDHLANNAVIAAKIFDGAVTSGKIGAGAVIDGKLGTNAVNATNIKDSAVSETKIATDAVTETAIKKDAVTGDKIKDNAVTTGKILNGAVGTDKLAGSAVTADKLGNGAVTTDKIGNNAITGPKIGAGAVATDKLNTAMHMLF